MFTMYIMTHKDIEIPNIEGYAPVLVGAFNKNNLKRKYTCCDDIGDNISHKNSNYCELTGIYWLWKNVGTEYIGICHYRRFFTKSLFYSNNSKYFLRQKDVMNLLSKYDVVLPKVRCEKGIIPQIVNIAPNKKDLEEMKTAISSVCPEYLIDYDWFLGQNKFYMYNMIITRKELFDSYCEWLFPILEYIEKYHNIEEEDDYRKRLFGFLSERLLLVWLKHNVDFTRIKEVPVINTGTPFYRGILQSINNHYREIYYKIKKKD